jgi:hypothetical protein
MKRLKFLIVLCLLTISVLAQEKTNNNNPSDYYTVTLKYNYEEESELQFTAVWDSVKLRYDEQYQYFDYGISMKGKYLDTNGNPLNVPYIDLHVSDMAIILTMLTKGEHPNEFKVKYGGESSDLDNLYVEWDEGYYLPPQITYYKSDTTVEKGTIKAGFYFEWAFDIRKKDQTEKEPLYLVSSFKLYEDFEKSCKESADEQKCNITIQDARIPPLVVRKIKKGKSFSFKKTNFGGATYKVAFDKID